MKFLDLNPKIALNEDTSKDLGNINNEKST